MAAPVRGLPAAVRIVPDSDAWPSGWRGMPDPPEDAHVLGDTAHLASPLIAVVGTRRATPRGLAVAEGLGRALAVRGWTVVSGMALGIDGAAHRGALAAGGATVAVMGTGPDQVFPASHRGLQAEIIASGCCITELPAGSPPLPWHFPRRNRLITGLARAVIVVEAPLRSGAMHTARLAADYDRELFAVPGPVDLEVSRGCHRLLRQGAVLLESAADVDEVLGLPSGTGAGQDTGTPPRPVAGSPAAWILGRLDLEGVRRDDLRGRWPGSEEQWVEGLAALELAGLIRRLPGGRLARRIWTA